MAPLIVYYVASTEYPEFTGLKARTYPGQEKPRQQPIVPERRFGHEQGKDQTIRRKLRVRRELKSKYYQVLPRITEEGANFTTVDIY